MKYKYLGYYESQSDALAALAAYHADPHKMDTQNITFKDVYKMWSGEHYSKIKNNTIQGYKCSYKACTMIYNLPFCDIRRTHLQKVIDTCNLNYGSLKILKVFLGAMFRFAIQNDIIDKNYAQFVDIVQYKNKNPNARPHEVFSQDEIDDLWIHNNDEGNMTTLMLIYTGCRISEFLDLKKEDIHLEERYFDIKKSKTENGVRQVPISEKIVPFFEHWLKKPGQYFMVYKNSKINYNTFSTHFSNSSNHTPHDARHTCVSLLMAFRKKHY